MTQIDDLNTKVDTLSGVVDATGTALTKLATDQAKSLADLKALITAGAPPADITVALGKLDASTTKLQAVADGINSLDADIIAADPTPTV